MFFYAIIFYLLYCIVRNLYKGHYTNTNINKTSHQIQQKIPNLNNIVSKDSYWAPEDTKGQQRVFKYPHYYGYGTESGFHYGEPYYLRTVNY